MSFDGVPKPSQLSPSTDPLSPYLGANQAAYEAQNRPKIQKSQASEKSKAVDHQSGDYLNEKEDKDEGLQPEEYEQILILARLRGIMNLSFKEGVLYQFHFNEETGLVELINENENTVMLTLSVEELLQVSQRMSRYAGRMSDHFV